MPKKYLSVNKKNLYNKIVGFITKKGNKINAAHIVNQAFLKVSKQTGFSMHQILLKLFLKLNSFVEIKKVRVRRRFYSVPFSISLTRRSYLIIKWLMQAVHEDTRKLPISEKLAFEIEQTIGQVQSKSVKIRNMNVTMALANRSNLHYRW